MEVLPYKYKLLQEHAAFLEELRRTEPNLVKSITNYTGLSFQSINAALRARKKSGLSEIPFQYSADEQDVKNLDEVFRRISPIQETITTYRGVTKQTNVAYEDPAFISTSFNFELAKNEYAGINCCIIVYTFPVGSKLLCIESISQFPREKEVLVQRDGTFQLTSFKGKHEDGALGGKDTFYLLFIPPNSVPLASSEIPLLDEFISQGKRKRVEDEELVDDMDFKQSLLHQLQDKVFYLVGEKNYNIRVKSPTPLEEEVLKYTDTIMNHFFSLNSEIMSPTFVKKAKVFLKKLNEIEPIIDSLVQKSQSERK